MPAYNAAPSGQPPPSRHSYHRIAHARRLSPPPLRRRHMHAARRRRRRIAAVASPPSRRRRRVAAASRRRRRRPAPASPRPSLSPHSTAHVVVALAAAAAVAMPEAAAVAGQHRPPARTLHSHCRACLSLVQRCSALRNHPVQPPSPLATACRPRNRRTPPPPPMTQQGPSPPSLASRASLKIHHLEAETNAVASIGANARADALSARTPGCWQALAATVRFACASPAACTHRPKLAPPRWNHRCCEHWRIRWANAL